MGCHTWFRNKISDMPQEHFDKLRKVHIKGIRKSYIYNCSCQEWLKGCEEELKELEKMFPTEESKHDDLYRMEYAMYKKHNSKEYYEKARGRYVKDLEILLNPKSVKRQVLGVFSRHDLSFDKDLKNGSYEMSDVGWHDNYRVSGNPYPCATHHNAEEAIKWLEEYNDGKNIICNLHEGMCDEVKNIITEFFNKFPNGTIHYG